MSKFGAHVTLGKHDGLGMALKKCSDAGSPIPVLLGVDQNLWADVQKYSPKTLLAFRTQIDGNPNPPSIWQGDPVAVADAWYDLRKPMWLKNPAHIYIPCNEMDAATLDQFSWQNDFDLRLMQRATVDGLRLGVGVHSTGTPSDDGGSTRFQKWERLIPSMQYAKSHGHVLILHEYGFDKTLPLSAPHHALRYRSVLDYLAHFDADPQVIIGECSDYNGYSGEGEAWLAGVEWYDQQVIGDPRVLGFEAYQLGMAENWWQLIPKWADYVAAHPTPADPVVPPVVPPIPPEPPRTYERVVHLLPQIADYADLLQVACEAYPKRETMTFSADDAVIAPVECTSRTVYVWDVEKWGGREAFETWVAKWYAPLPKIIYREFTA